MRHWLFIYNIVCDLGRIVNTKLRFKKEVAYVSANEKKPPQRNGFLDLEKFGVLKIPNLRISF
jgi:hypothetical protein